MSPEIVSLRHIILYCKEYLIKCGHQCLDIEMYSNGFFLMLLSVSCKLSKKGESLIFIQRAFLNSPQNGIESYPYLIIFAPLVEFIFVIEIFTFYFPYLKMPIQNFGKNVFCNSEKDN